MLFIPYGGDAMEAESGRSDEGVCVCVCVRERERERAMIARCPLS